MKCAVSKDQLPHAYIGQHVTWLDRDGRNMTKISARVRSGRFRRWRLLWIVVLRESLAILERVPSKMMCERYKVLRNTTLRAEREREILYLLSAYYRRMRKTDFAVLYIPGCGIAPPSLS